MEAMVFSKWWWTFMMILHFFGLILIIGTVGLFDMRIMGFLKDCRSVRCTGCFPGEWPAWASIS